MRMVGASKHREIKYLQLALMIEVFYEKIKIGLWVTLYFRRLLMKIFFCGVATAAAAALYAVGWVGERNLVNVMHLFYGYESSSLHPSLSDHCLKLITEDDN